MNPTAAPASVAAPRTQSLRAPALRRRMASWLYEGTLMFGVVVLPGLIFGIATNTRHALDNRHALQALLFAVLALYFVYFWVKGQTLPMKTWHIRVVDRHGLPLRWPRALLRYLLIVGAVIALLTGIALYVWDEWLWSAVLDAYNVPHDLREIGATLSRAQKTVLQYPMNIGVIVLAALVGVWAFRERLGWLNRAGLALAVAAVLILATA